MKADTYHSFLSSPGLLVNIFTMVEENFVFQSFETLQNKGFSLGFLVIRFTMIEESFS